MTVLCRLFQPGRRLADTVGRLGALPAERFTQFLDAAEDIWDIDPLLSEDEALFA
jgi:hypothetical protein